ncbi:helix-turn-helix transcriptional regulator [Lysinibacillus sp. BPa_S21]|uniref:helix-turn-helix domain-containing protein n=1 Tax=Lysinibacillus sp. BPa_S21 TaxID=2932478 RepID=UPI0020125C9D|nr:helix-turn-helix transcriptional regulator [Lysinibacillus sp. BPa_S21]MCL1696304.1 helix-turn-helix domain-containing protein [Lysinibacillus sp. BPa_S21]
MEVLGARLKKLREENKAFNKEWTQGYVADKLCVARVTYTAYENGTKQPTLETLINIADLFDVSIDYLLGRSIQKGYDDVDSYIDEFVGIIETIPKGKVDESKMKILAYSKGLADAYSD